MRVERFKRGQIWWHRGGLTYNGSVQGGTRPVIIISNELANRFSKNLTIIPCTSQEKTDLPTHVEFEINGASTSLAENIMTVSKDNIGQYIGTCDDELMERIDETLKIAIGLVPIVKKEKEEEPKSAIVEFITTAPEVEQITEPTLVRTPMEIENTKQTRKTWTLDEKIRFVNDFENHDSNYMIKKYNLRSAQALSTKAYVFKKYIKEHEA